MKILIYKSTPGNKKMVLELEVDAKFQTNWSIHRLITIKPPPWQFETACHFQNVILLIDLSCLQLNLAYCRPNSVEYVKLDNLSNTWQSLRIHPVGGGEEGKKGPALSPLVSSMSDNRTKKTKFSHAYLVDFVPCMNDRKEASLVLLPTFI